MLTRGKVLLQTKQTLWLRRKVDIINVVRSARRIYKSSRLQSIEVLQTIRSPRDSFARMISYMPTTVTRFHVVDSTIFCSNIPWLTRQTIIVERYYNHSLAISCRVSCLFQIIYPLRTKCRVHQGVQSHKNPTSNPLQCDVWGSTGTVCTVRVNHDSVVS